MAHHKTPEQIESLFEKILLDIKKSENNSGTFEQNENINSQDIMDLYISEYIRRETPMELAMRSDEAPCNPGLYIWCNREYSTIHWQYISNKD